MKQYSINQYPKFRKDEDRKLSGYQIIIRKNQRVYIYDKAVICNQCHHKLDVNEFYIKDRATGRRNSKCRDCQMRNDGVVEIGKTRFAKNIAEKGFRRCSICKEIKSLSLDFPKNKSDYKGISNNCKSCGFKLHKAFISNQRETLGDSYVKEYGKLRGIKKFTKKIMQSLRDEIEESRKPKYFIDGKEFVTCMDLARYILDVYKHEIGTTEKRINAGYTEEECKLSEFEIRRLKSGTNKGNVKVTDTITGKVWYFFNTKDEELMKMFSLWAINKAIKHGNLTGGYNNSKYPNPCKIERL